MRRRSYSFFRQRDNEAIVFYAVRRRSYCFCTSGKNDLLYFYGKEAIVVIEGPIVFFRQRAKEAIVFVA